MHLASKYGHTKVVEILVAAGANVDVKNKDGKTAADCVGEKNSSMSNAAKEEIRKVLRPSDS